MNYQIVITQVARRDIFQAVDYITYVLKNPKAANDLIDEINRKINALVPFPTAHPIVQDKLLATWQIRFIKIKNYLAFYLIKENKIIVFRFIYIKRNWISILNSETLDSLEK